MIRKFDTTEKKYFVYMLECSNGSYYTGYTVDINRRYQQHLNGTASKYTKSFPPKKVAVCWTIESDSKSVAMKLEAAIKKLSVDQKRKLIAAPKTMLIDSLATVITRSEATW